MVLFNSATRTKEPLQTLREGEVRLYLCGPTVYDDAHLGHARSAVAFDLLRRVLREEGYRVIMARNITDIDDKIIAKAAREGVSVKEIAERYTARYHAEMDQLRVERPEIEPKATESLDEMVALIEQLHTKGVAYHLPNGDWYFDTAADSAYGSLSGRRDDEESQHRITHEIGKKSPRDFALWKASDDLATTFATPLGRGRPGWHLECSAMIKKHLAIPDAPYQIDIHGGGGDLFFPHHENEAAQTRCAYNQQLARYWVHNGFVTINNEKMSKSLGNSFFLKDALVRYDGEVLRNYLIATHYRAHFNFSEEDLLKSKKRLDRLYRLKRRLGTSKPSQPDEAFKTAFMAALADDLNISVALAEVEAMIVRANEALDAYPKDKELKATIAANLELVARVLGIGLHSPTTYFQLGVDEAQQERIATLIHERTAAKKAKDFARADAIRAELAASGIALMDTPEGTIWEKVEDES
ncbi:MAG: cysteine--tRNA ligase [Campylobacterales bacterium]